MTETALQINDKRMQIAEEPAQGMDIMTAALNKGYSIDDLERLMSLRDRNDAFDAKKAYNEAMAAFNQLPLTVIKDKYNNQFKSWYCSLGNLLTAVRPGLGANGLSLSFPTPTQTEKGIVIGCEISHEKGYSKIFAINFPIAIGAIGKESGKPSRSPIQDIKATLTYGRSATCEMALGIAGTEASEDDDGNGTQQEPEYITADQVIEINDLIKETSTDLTKFLEVATAERVEEILAVNYAVLVKNLKKKREAKK
jgi:hypothetical protein